MGPKRTQERTQQPNMVSGAEHHCGKNMKPPENLNFSSPEWSMWKRRWERYRKETMLDQTPGGKMMLGFLGVLLLIYIAPGLIPRRSWLRFYVCYLTYAVHGCFLPTALIPLQLVSYHLYSLTILAIASFAFKLMRVKWDIRNKDHYDSCKGGILVANHQSVFDAAGILFLNNGLEHLTGIAKKELRCIPPVGLLFWVLGIIFIDRNKSKEAMDVMKAAILQNQDKKILIFPEGTRNQQGDGLLNFKRGAFRLAIEHKMSVVPVVFSPYTFIRRGKEFSGGKVIISCLKPIETKDLHEGDVDSLMNRTRELMQTEYFKLRAELGKNNNNHIN